jgi:hypothetical protein
MNWIFTGASGVGEEITRVGGKDAGQHSESVSSGKPPCGEEWALALGAFGGRLPARVGR